MRRTKPYITSRQVQKLSSAGPARSVSPAIARWKAWLCRLGMPGTTGPAARSTPSGGASSPASTQAISPCASKRSSTPEAQPPASSARSQNSRSSRRAAVMAPSSLSPDALRHLASK